MTDSADKTYTRLSAQDNTKWEWVELNHKLSEYDNDGNGTGSPEDYFVTRQDALTAGSAITTVTDSTTVSKVVPETGTVADVTAKKLFEYMWKKIYPVGSIYISANNDDPATLFGGTWTLIGADRVLWGVKASTTPGSTLGEQLPNITGNVDFTGGAQGHPEVTYESGALRKSDYGNLTYPQPSGSSSAYHGIRLDASKSNSVYTANGIVRPNAYTVHFWRRTS